MAMNGTDILLLVFDGAAYDVVGSQRDVTFEETTDEIDVSSKDSRNKRVLPGRYSATISLDALYVPSDDAYEKLQDAMRTGVAVKVMRQEDGVSLESADAIVTSISAAGPDQGEATISVALTIDGAWTEYGT